MSKSFDAWTQTYKNYLDKGEGFLWPSETLVRLLKGRYIPGLNKEYDGKRVIDIGFGNGNNLVFLKSLGMETYGIEVSEEICALSNRKLLNLGYQTDLRMGHNREIPFDTGFFDYLVSWNVIHYENSEEKMHEAIKEYCRVLKPGGRFFISTTDPDAFIKKHAERITKNLWRIGREDDFRKGEIYFYYESPEDIVSFFGNCFAEVSVGRMREELFTETLDCYIITGVKK